MIAVLSDIHGNLEALNAVLKECKSRGVKEYLILGDLVDYGADSVQVVLELAKLAQDYDIYCIRGNHDNAIVHNDCSRFRTAHGKQSFEITHKELREADPHIVKFLREDLPPYCRFTTDEGQEILLVHGNANDHFWGSYGKMTPMHHNLLVGNRDKVIFCGHTHIRGFKLLEDGTCVINPGSVGQPRNGDPRAQFIIIKDNPDKLTGPSCLCEPVSVDYDIDTAARKIIESGRPSFLATRLYLGI